MDQDGPHEHTGSLAVLLGQQIDYFTILLLL